jgi:hypothetical protein
MARKEGAFSALPQHVQAMLLLQKPAAGILISRCLSLEPEHGFD